MLGNEAWGTFARIATPGVYAEKPRGLVSLSGRPPRRAGERYLARAAGQARGQDGARTQERDGAAGAEASGHGDSQTG